jgi:uncharacterized membrane protein required for colicin V production
MYGLENYHWLDIAIVVLLALGGMMGAVSGLLRQIVWLVTYVTSVYAAIWFHQPVAFFLKDKLDGAMPETSPLVASPLSYGLTFFATYLALIMLTALFTRSIRAFSRRATDPGVQKATRALGPRVLNRLLGAVVATALTSQILGAIFTGLALCPNAHIEARLAGSELRPPLVRSVQAVIVAIPQKYKDELNQAVVRLKQTGTTVTGELLGQRMHQLSGEVNSFATELQQFQNGAAKPSNGPRTEDPNLLFRESVSKMKQMLEEGSR